GLRRLDALRALAVEHRGVVVARLAGRVELAHGARQPRDVDLERLREFLDGVRRGLRDLLDPVFVANHVDRLRVEDLDRGALGLLHDLAPVLRIRVVAVVRPLVDEALAAQVDDDADRIRVLLEVVEHDPVAERRRADVPGHRVAGGPSPKSLRADVERGLDAVAGVVAAAPDAARLPTGAVIADAHLGIRLETAAGQDDRARGEFLVAVRPHDADPGDRPRAILQQLAQRGRVPDLDPHPLGALDQRVDEPPSAADGLDVHSAVEVMLAVDLERLP